MTTSYNFFLRSYPLIMQHIIPTTMFVKVDEINKKRYLKGIYEIRIFEKLKNMQCFLYFLST